MKIDISGLSEAELVDLNNRIVERLRFLQHALTGVLTRYNRKTVTVVTDGGNVVPLKKWWQTRAAMQQGACGSR